MGSTRELPPPQPPLPPGFHTARAPRRVIALCVDAVLAGTGVAAASIMLMGSPSAPNLAILGPAAMSLLAAIALLVRMRRGTTPGQLLCGLRTVARPELLPRMPFHRTNVTLDIRRGSDPLHPALSPLSVTPHGSGLAPAQTHWAWLEFDDGLRCPVRRPTVIGRMPDGIVEGDALTTVTDLSRTLAASHARLVPSLEGIAVTDLDTTTGTSVVSDSVEHVVGPGETVIARIGEVLRFGERRALVRAGTWKERGR